MSIDIKAIVQARLCDDLTEDDMYLLLNTVYNKISRGASVIEVANDMLSSMTESIISEFPSLSQLEAFEIAEQTSDRLLDKLTNYVYMLEESGLMDEEEVLSYERLN